MFLENELFISFHVLNLPMSSFVAYWLVDFHKSLDFIKIKPSGFSLSALLPPSAQPSGSPCVGSTCVRSGWARTRHSRSWGFRRTTTRVRAPTCSPATCSRRRATTSCRGAPAACRPSPWPRCRLCPELRADLRPRCVCLFALSLHSLIQVVVLLSQWI